MLNLLNWNLVNLLFKVRSYSSKAPPLTLLAKEASIGLILGDATLLLKYPNG